MHVDNGYVARNITKAKLYECFFCSKHALQVLKAGEGSINGHFEDHLWNPLLTQRRALGSRLDVAAVDEVLPHSTIPVREGQGLRQCSWNSW